MRLLPPLFFPLDEELALGPTRYSPLVHEAIVRLGTWLPFEQVPAGLAHFTGVATSRETARRLTEAAGAALVAAETAAVEQLERTSPPPPVVPPTLHQVSVDGVMVPLVHKGWAEAKMLAIGRVVDRVKPDGTRERHATELSYFGRLTDADTFRRLAWVETHRRGITLAPHTCGVGDGAAWCQGFYDWHCPDAVRILDWGHAAEYVSAAGRSVWGRGSAALTGWLDQQLQELKTGDPDAVLAALRALPPILVPTATGYECPRDEAVQYLEARRAQIAYAAFTAAGYPIGSGTVESANKLVVGARLDGTGMHWARANVNPMLALRGATCSDQWAAAWAALRAEQHRQRATRRTQRVLAQAAPASAPTPAPSATVPPPTAHARRTVARLPLGRMKDGRPTASHPWRKPFFRPRTPDTAAAKS
jgi:hypothetical protein